MSLVRIGLDGRGFPSELGRRRRGGARSHPRIAAVEGLEDVGDRDIDGRPPVADRRTALATSSVAPSQVRRAKATMFGAALSTNSPVPRHAAAGAAPLSGPFDSPA